ncbi:MAG: hypothetical protein MNPFHGCM_00376 [Gemmatimonadaceae bacterium]|nr:hypothetical protein [Gemmatimonadaceae bacterium]
MSVLRQSAPGTTRVCPHCRASILESASVCPACRHHLRFDPGAATRTQASFTPLRVEGTIRHPDAGEAWEYSVLITIRNEKGEEVTRQVVGVGALQPEEQRTFSLAVDVYTPSDAKALKGVLGR